MSALFPVSPGGLSAAAVQSWPGWDGGECPICGAFLAGGGVDGTLLTCASCASVPPFDFARSLFTYEGPVRDAILAAKYARQPVPADAMAERLLEAWHGKWGVRIPAGFRPAVVPVPIRPLKYFRRGFNLPSLVGKALSRIAGWPFSPLVLHRRAENLPQAATRLSEREENVRGVFAVPWRRRSPCEVLLVDDVYTSGATARACSRALKTGGTEHIVVVTVARTVL